MGTSLGRYIQNKDQNFTIGYSFPVGAKGYQFDDQLFNLRQITYTEGAYQFNWGEKVGNFFLEPQKAIIDAWDKTGNPFFQFLLVIATLAAAVFTLIGLVFKSIGEQCQSESTRNTRFEAIQWHEKIKSESNKTSVSGTLEMINLINTISSLPGSHGVSGDLKNWNEAWSGIKTILMRAMDEKPVSGDDIKSLYQHCAQIKSLTENSHVSKCLDNLLSLVRKPDPWTPSLMQEIRELYNSYVAYQSRINSLEGEFYMGRERTSQGEPSPLTAIRV